MQVIVFSDETVTDFSRGFQLFNCLKLPKVALFDVTAFAVFLNPMRCKGIYFSHIQWVCKDSIMILMHNFYHSDIHTCMYIGTQIYTQKGSFHSSRKNKDQLKCCNKQKAKIKGLSMPADIIVNVTLSHLRSKEPPGLHFVSSPASQANCKCSQLARATSGQCLYRRICLFRLWGSTNTW